MNERLRLDYLDAMGIVQYAARFPLPGALPSLVECDDIDDSESQTDVQAVHTTSAYIPSAQENIRKILSTEKPETTPTTPQKKPSPSTQENTVFHCQVALWAVDDLLVLAETPRMDNHQLILLRNILKAIGRSEQLTSPSQFSWPLPQHKDKSLSAARDHFQGMLDGGALKNTATRQILCFGNTVTTLLSNDDQHTAVTSQYHDWPITAVCTLNAMLEQPARKKDAWRTLQILVRA